MKKTDCLPKLLLFAFCLSGIFASGQGGNKIPIAIIAFRLAPNAAVTNPGDVTTIQELVTSEFVSRSRFLILDRSKFDAILSELKVQRSEEFLDSKVVEQGRMIGAKYIVTGVISEYRTVVTTESTTLPTNLTRPLGSQKTTYDKVSTAKISFSFQVIDVEKGNALFSKVMNGSSKSTGILSADDLDNAICQVKKEVKTSIVSLFPNEIHIIKIETADKKGRPETVLIDEGAASFSQTSKSDGCGNGSIDLGSIFQKKRGTALVVYEIEKMTVNGKEIIREKTIGEIEVDKVEGDVSVCNVRKGKEEIGDRLKAGAVLLVKTI